MRISNKLRSDIHLKRVRGGSNRYATISTVNPSTVSRWIIRNKPNYVTWSNDEIRQFVRENWVELTSVFSQIRISNQKDKKILGRLITTFKRSIDPSGRDLLNLMSHLPQGLDLVRYIQDYSEEQQQESRYWLGVIIVIAFAIGYAVGRWHGSQ